MICWVTKELSHLWNLKTVASLSAAVLLVVTTIMFSAVESQAQEQTLTASIGLVDQSDWVEANQSFSMALDVRTTLPSDQVDLVTTVYNPVSNRSSFIHSLTNKIEGSVAFVDRAPVSEKLDGSGVVNLNFPVGDMAQRKFYLKSPGVYPVKVELRESGATTSITEIITHLIYLPMPRTDVSNLNVSVVLPVQAPLSINSKDIFSVPDNAEGLIELANALENFQDMPLNLAVEPETIERLEKAAVDYDALLEKLSYVARNHSVMTSSWTPSVSATFEDELSSEGGQQLDRANNILNKYFRSVSHNTFLTTDPLKDEALTFLQGRGVERLVVAENIMMPIQRSTTLARPFLVSASRSKNSMPAIQIDSGLSKDFISSPDPVLTAHRLLADLAVIWNDRPNQLREVVLMPPRDWNPSSQVLTEFLQGLRNNPILNATSLEDTFAVPKEGTSKVPLTRRILPPDSGAELEAKQIRENRRLLNGFGSITQPNNTIKDELERRLLYAQSADLTKENRKRQLDEFNRVLEGQLTKIDMPPDRSIQLTARAGEIPISIQNDTNSPLSLKLTLTSDKLEFPEGNERIIHIDRASATTTFAIDARTSGAFPVQVTLESPDGSLQLAKSKITVRSTATTGIGLFLSIGAGTFLLLWWMRSAWRTHKLKKEVAI